MWTVKFFQSVKSFKRLTKQKRHLELTAREGVSSGPGCNGSGQRTTFNWEGQGLFQWMPGILPAEVTGLALKIMCHRWPARGTKMRNTMHQYLWKYGVCMKVHVLKIHDRTGTPKINPAPEARWNILYYLCFKKYPLTDKVMPHFFMICTSN